MKNIKLLMMILTIGVLFSACYKEDPLWLEENADLSGQHYPLVPYFDKLTDGSEFYFGQTVDFEMNYWSIDPIAAVKLMENGVEYFSTGYAEALSPETNMDSIIFTYTTHQMDAPGAITISGLVVTEPGLERASSSIDITVCPEDIAGTYNATTIALDTAGVSTTTTSSVVITKPGDDYMVSDFTGGYFTDTWGGGSELLMGGVMDKGICHFTATVPDALSDTTYVRTFTVDGAVKADLSILVNWKNSWSIDGEELKTETGTTLLVKQ